MSFSPLVINLSFRDYLTLLSQVSNKATEYKEQLLKEGYQISHPQTLPKQDLSYNENYKAESMIYGSFQAFFNTVILINYHATSVYILDFNLFTNDTTFQLTIEELHLIQFFKDKLI